LHWESVFRGFREIDWEEGNDALGIAGNAEEALC
jgi:hypothetical protein